MEPRTKENPDAQLVCLDGHLISSEYYGHPEERKDHCPADGQPTIHACPNCEVDIPGTYYWKRNVFRSQAARRDAKNWEWSPHHPKEVPAHCAGCGAPYPWTDRRRQEDDDRGRRVRDITQMTHFFISYSHRDHDFAEILMTRMRSAGLEPWADDERLEVGDNWRDGIDEAIRTSAALILVMTPEAKASEYVTYEWGFAIGSGVPVVPLMVSKTDLHPRLEPLQYLNFCAPTSRRWDRLLSRLQALLSTNMASQEGRVPTHQSGVVERKDGPDGANHGGAGAAAVVSPVFGREEKVLEVEVIGGELIVEQNQEPNPPRDAAMIWTLQLQFYAVQLSSRSVSIPFHRCRAKAYLTLYPDGMQFDALDLWAGSPIYGNDDPITRTMADIQVRRSGLFFMDAKGKSRAVDYNVGKIRVTADLAVAGSDRPVTVDYILPRKRCADHQLSRWAHKTSLKVSDGAGGVKEIDDTW